MYAVLKKSMLDSCGRLVVRRVIRRCVIGDRYRQAASSQMMADLPSIRVNPASVFYHCGVDFAGPIQLKLNGSTTIKGYVIRGGIHLYGIQNGSSGASE